MILVSAALVLAAIVLLIAGVVLAKPFLVMWSIVVSVLSAVCLLIGALLRRHELFPAGGRPKTPPLPTPPLPAQQPAHVGVPAYSGAPQAASPMTAAPAPPSGTSQAGPHLGTQQMPLQQTQQMAYPGAPAAPPRPPMSRTLPPGGLGPDSIVIVIPGRKRFHLPNCRQLAGREVEELTVEEAREEGFTPCTTCIAESASPMAPGTTAPSTAAAGTTTAPSATAPSAPPVIPPTSSPVVPPTSSPVVPSPVVPPATSSSVPPASSPVIPPATSEWTAFQRPKPAVQEPQDKPEPPVEPAAQDGPAPADPTVEANRPATAPATDSDADPGEETTVAIEQPEKGGTVKVIVGTRRFHDSSCPLIEAADDSGIETMTRTEAEQAGLTHCTACGE
ncbi:hypothetical protein [Acrocarpospora catenulata]|uniref:hypothetical protein n=1 Tax=Acrocarpospora catenulata TaxID=2836182 RepID=UPI001BDA7B61|nr:hypothetical protein [Acrocarpospora catenulata]